MRISDWSSDVCSSDLRVGQVDARPAALRALRARGGQYLHRRARQPPAFADLSALAIPLRRAGCGAVQRLDQAEYAVLRAGGERRRTARDLAVDRDRKSTRLNSSH